MIIKELDYLQKEEFLEHFGVKGQKWGVRKKLKPEDTSLRLALKERQRLKSEGRLTQEEITRGNIRFGRNLALAMLAGAAGGRAIASLIVKSI